MRGLLSLAVLTGVLGRCRTSGRHVHPVQANPGGAVQGSLKLSVGVRAHQRYHRRQVLQTASTWYASNQQMQNSPLGIKKINHRSTIPETNVATTRQTRSRNAIQFHHFRLCVSASKLIGMLPIGKGGWCACRSNLLDRNVVALLHMLESQVFTSAACVYYR